MNVIHKYLEIYAFPYDDNFTLKMTKLESTSMDHCWIAKLLLSFVYGLIEGLGCQQARLIL